jgi:hypothetical protein
VVKNKMEIGTDDKLLLSFIGLDLADPRTERQMDMCFICNRDGSLRWLYPASNKKASFLKFYAKSSFRAKIISFGIRILARCGFNKLVQSGDLRVTFNEQLILARVLKKFNHATYSIFTGTRGLDRKLIIELNNQKETFLFVKVPITENSNKLIDNEVKMLNLISGLKLRDVVIPKVTFFYPEEAVGLTNVASKDSKQGNNLSRVHYNALGEIYGACNKKLRWTEVLRLLDLPRIYGAIEEYRDQNDSIDTKKVRAISRRIKRLADELGTDSYTTVSIAHGDFTPWNMYERKSALVLIDWELGFRNAPLLFDLFHFVFQTGIMMQNASYNSIVKKLVKALEDEKIRELVRTYNIDIRRHYKFYLMHVITSYLPKYLNQEKLHGQALACIEIWSIALERVGKECLAPES